MLVQNTTMFHYANTISQEEAIAHFSGFCLRNRKLSRKYEILCTSKFTSILIKSTPQIKHTYNV